MMSHARIDVMQFEYGGTYRDANRRLRDVYDLLAGSDYKLFRIGARLDHVPQWMESLEDTITPTFLAVHARIAPYIGIGPRQLPTCRRSYRAMAIPVRGAIHVGAHTGEEVDTYRKSGVPRMIMIEAIPGFSRIFKCGSGAQRTSLRCSARSPTSMKSGASTYQCEPIQFAAAARPTLPTLSTDRRAE